MPSITLLWPRCLLLCGWNFLIRIFLQCYLMNQKICNLIWCPTVYEISSDVLLESISCFCSILLMRCRSARSPCGQGICFYTGGPHVTEFKVAQYKKKLSCILIKSCCFVCIYVHEVTHTYCKCGSSRTLIIFVPFEMASWALSNVAWTKHKNVQNASCIFCTESKEHFSATLVMM